MFKEIRNRPLRYFAIFIYAIIVSICAMELNLFWLFGYSPNHRDVTTPIQSVASELYTADGVLIGRYFKEDRTPVSFDEISTSIKHALVATEDIRFYKHNGVDPIALLSSVWSTASGDRRGGSTITQQLAKNLFRTRYQHSLGLLDRIPGVRIVIIKLKEWLTAYKLEANYPKEEIMTMYLNTVSFGNNAYGISAASKRYFNKTPREVAPAEAAMLIGMLKGTTLYNPLRNPETALERRNVVLEQMRKAGYLDETEFARHIDLGLQLAVGEASQSRSSDSYLRTAVEKWLEDWSEERGLDIYTDGLKIYTTIDSRMQRHAENVMAQQMKILQNRLNQSWAGELPWRDLDGEVIPDFLMDLAERTPHYQRLQERFPGQEDSLHFYLHQPREMEVFTWEGPKIVNYSTMDSLAHYVKMLNMGMMSMDPYDGRIKVWVGGIQHQYFKFDHVMQAKRQPGSTFKTFAYLAALEEGMTPCDKFTDRPVRISYVENGESMEWTPRNADWVFTGRDMSLRWAMGKSVNSITAQITEKVGWDKVVGAARRAGITSDLASVPSISLGPSEVNIFEMVNAYATFINEGKKIEPILVEKIVDQHGEVVFESKLVSEQVIDPEIAWLMTYMLRGSMEEPEGTSQGLWEWDLWKNGNQIGGKTGTSSDYADGWYMGMTKDLVTGVWVGCDDRSVRFRNSQTGEASRTALPIFGRFMEEIYRDTALGYTYGPLPAPTVEITRSYQCPSPRVAKPDTSSFEDRILPPPPTMAQPEVPVQIVIE